MGETSNFYEKCSSLSKKGDEKSLRTLLQMGISGNKTARVALRKTRNKKLLKTLIDEYLDNIPSEYNAGMILNLAVKVLRKEYLYVYLMEIFHEKKDLKEIGFFKSVKDIPLDKQEQIEVKKYIIDTKDFDIRLISLIAVEEREDILYALLTKAMDDGLDARTTKIFLANKDYLQLIQPELREAIEKRVEGTSIFATYLDLKEKDNQKCIADFEKISLIYLAVKENVWDYGEMDFYHNSISIAFKLCRNEELTSSDWKEIKESIDEELLGVHDGNNATKMLFDLLLILSKYDYSYAEAKLITIYNRTDLYSSKALEILGELHSEFAYKEFLKKIIIAEQETECFHTAVRLIGFFPEREKAIIEYIKILDDSRLVEVIHEKAQKALANKNKIVDESIEGIPFVGKKCSVLSNNIVLNELLIKLGEQIKATQFFAAVGFSFSSGLRLVKPLMDQVRTENDESGLVAAEKIKKTMPQIKVIIVTSLVECSFIDRARKAGVESFWYKDAGKEELLEVMDRTMKGENVYPDAPPVVMIGTAKSCDFTPGELAVLRLVVEGESYKKIAESLCISPETVKWHIKNMLQKTNFDSKTKLAVAVTKKNLIINGF